jgi:NAD(P)-dependent dehydrogenase (short-subunit alcohol dehydrogenase family)
MGLPRLPKEPRVVITGAGSGLGRALALVLAERNARLLVSDHNLASVEETARLARDAGAREVRVARCDVTKVDEVEALARTADDAWGGTDVVANNAGVGGGGRVGEISLEDWKWTIDVDLWGVIHGCHVFVPRMRKQGSGHVLNVASAAGLICGPRMAPYNVAKAGVVALSETLAAELAGSGVYVTALCPTFFRTNITRDGRYTNDKMKEIAERLMGRSTISADSIARASLAAMERGDLYAVPMADGRWLWRLKRYSPAAYRFLNRTIEKRMMSGADG